MISFPPYFYRNNNLKNKWWHRLFVTIYTLILVIIFLISLFIFTSIGIVPPTTWNTNYTTLKTFMNSQTENSGNAIPSFLNLPGAIGCIAENQHIEYVYEPNLRASYCRFNLVSHIDDAASYFHNDFYLNEDIENIKQKLLSLDKPTSGDNSYCFISKDANCHQIGSIVKYKKNAIYYLLAIFWSIITIFIVSFFLQLIYYKGFIFIIYGNSKK